MEIRFRYDGNDNENYDLFLMREGREDRRIAEVFMGEDEVISLCGALNDAVNIGRTAEELIKFKLDMQFIP